MKSFVAVLALMSASAFATPVASPSKVEHQGGHTQYSYELGSEQLAPLVVVVPDTTVPLQRIYVVNKAAPAASEPQKVVVVGQPSLPGGVKSAKEAMQVWGFAQLLEHANTAFQVPETVKLGQSTEIKLTIDPTKPADNEAEQKTGSNAKGEKVDISRVVVAKILAPDFDVIEVINDGRQVLNPSGPTEWRWTVTPKKIGEYKINVTVSAVIEIGSDRAERLVKVFNQEVTVFVTATDAAKYFFTKNWQWLWSTLILPFGIWIWKNKKKKKSLIQLNEEEAS